MDELFAQAQEDGWGDVIKTEADIPDALENDIDKPGKPLDNIDMYAQEELERAMTEKYGDDWRNSEDFKRDLESLGGDTEANLKGEVAKEVAQDEGGSPEEGAALDQDTFDWLSGEYGSGNIVAEQGSLFGPAKPEKKAFELTPEKPTKHEEVQRLEREGFVKKLENIPKKGPPAFETDKGVRPEIVKKDQASLLKKPVQQVGLFEYEPTKGIDVEFKPEPGASKRPEAILGRQTRMATTGNIRAAGCVVGDLDSAVSLLSHIRKAAQENAYTVTTDSNGRVLEVHRYSKGSKSGSKASPMEIAGRILNVDDAKFQSTPPRGGRRHS